MELDFFKFILTIGATIFSCYKYIEKELNKKVDKLENERELESIIKEVEKKVDKLLYDRELEFIKKSIQENTLNLSSKLETMGEDMKIIKEHLLKNH